MPLSLSVRCLLVALLSVVAALMLDATRAETDKAKKYALLVGVRDYDSGKFDPLKYTQNDAEELAGVLQKQAGFSVRVLTTSRGEKRKEDLPTRDNLRAAIGVLLAGKKRDDTVLIALAGHGMQAAVKEGDKEKDESFFCPSDAAFSDHDTLLSLSKLFADLDNSDAGVKLLLVDACRNDPGLGRNVNQNNLRPPNGTAALFSCKSGERAFETPKLGRGHGVFFHHVIEGLKGQAKNRRGEVTWSRLADYVTESVSDEVPKLIGAGAKQTPEQKLNLTGKSPVLIASIAVALARGDPTKEKVVKDWGKEVTNSIGMKLVRIPAGVFQMGATKVKQDEAIADYEKQYKKKVSDAIRAFYRSEGPRHEVEITKAFYLGICEVTQKQYAKVMGTNPSWFSAGGGGKDKVKGMSTDNFPVERVSWQEAVRFCEKLAELPAEKGSGRKYRLPTEAEWEYSCRGGAPSSRPFNFGPSLSSKLANFDGNHPYGGAGKGNYLERTCQVGQYAKNGFGLFDMHGNVWEWCSDWYGADYYSKSPPRDPQGPSAGSLRVIRGGAWDDGARFCRSAYRYRRAPGDHGHFLGFRVALVPAQDQ